MWRALNSITGDMFWKPANGRKPVNRLTGYRFHKPTSDPGHSDPRHFDSSSTRAEVWHQVRHFSTGQHWTLYSKVDVLAFTIASMVVALCSLAIVVHTGSFNGGQNAESVEVACGERWSRVVMWRSWSKFAFVDCEFWLSKSIECECK